MFLSASLQSVVIMLMIFWSRLKPQAPVAVGGGASQGRYYSREPRKLGEVYDVLISGQCPGVSAIWAHCHSCHPHNKHKHRITALRRKTTLETITERLWISTPWIQTNILIPNRCLVISKTWEDNSNSKFFLETHLFHVSLLSWIFRF